MTIFLGYNYTVNMTKFEEQKIDRRMIKNSQQFYIGIKMRFKMSI